MARTLGVSITELESIIVHNATRKIFPRNFNEKHLVKAIDIIRSEAFADGSARIELKNGRVFWGPREGQSEALCRLLRNMLPKLIVPGAYGVAVEANLRYPRGWGSYDHFPNNGRVIEVGAKRGYQAVGFAERLGLGSQVLAVEMDASDYAYMSKTFSANEGLGQLTPVHAAVSSENGRTVSYGGPVRTVSSGLQELEDSGEQTTQTSSLKKIMELNDIERVDFLNVMVNGEELKVLEGLGERLSDVKIIRIASYYSDKYGDMASQCARFVSDRGGKVLSSNFPGIYLEIAQ